MLTLSNNTRQPLPQLPYQQIASQTLGAKYDLSLVFIGDKKMRRLNQTYRQKDKPTNVLSFPYSTHNGDLFIDLLYAKKEAPKYKHTYRQHILFLFIHGLLHLKGMDHGSKMERREQQLLALFNH